MIEVIIILKIVGALSPAQILASISTIYIDKDL